MNKKSEPARRGAGAWWAYLRAVGPGLVTGASDDDPSGIATYAQAGAQFRYGLLWTALYTLPLMASVEEICDRTALATGKGLGELARTTLTGWRRPVVGVLLACLIVANGLNIAADLLAVGSGMALLHAGPSWLWSIIGGALITGLLIAGSFAAIARAFKVLCLALLTYFAVVFVSRPGWGGVAVYALVPHLELSGRYVGLLVAILGTTISPYLFFWQSAHRIQDMRDEPEGGEAPLSLKRRGVRAARRKERTSRFDVFGGIAFSNLVMFVIIVATGSTLGRDGSVNIESAAQAAAALKPVAGRFAEILFALGFIGSGMLAIPVLAGSGAAGMAGLLGKEWGFARSIRKAPVFYALVMLGTLGGTALSLLAVNPIHLLVVVALVNGFAAAPFLFVVMIVSGDRATMGEYANGHLASVLGWGTVAIMTAAALSLLIPSVSGI